MPNHTRFSDAPAFQYAVSPRDARILREVVMIAAGYGEVNYDDRGFSWVHVPGFVLPRGWNVHQTGILLDLPPEYPSVPPDGFYLIQGLRNSRGETPSHYFQEAGSLNKHASRGWAWYCMHARGGWRATADVVTGHNLLKYLELVRTILSNPPRH